MTVRKQKKRRARAGSVAAGGRSGLAAIEVVLAAGISLPIVVFVFYWGIQACRVLFCLIGTMVGSPNM